MKKIIIIIIFIGIVCGLLNKFCTSSFTFPKKPVG